MVTDEDIRIRVSGSEQAEQLLQRLGRALDLLEKGARKAGRGLGETERAEEAAGDAAEEAAKDFARFDASMTKLSRSGARVSDTLGKTGASAHVTAERVGLLSRAFTEIRERAERAGEALGIGAFGGRLALAGGIAYLGVQAGKAVFDFAQLGAQVRDVERAFYAAGGTASTFNAAMENLRGTVSDDYLRRQFNLAKNLGISADQFAELTKIAKAAAAALGIDTSQALNDITIAVSRQSKMIADNLGLRVDQQKAEQELARSLGKTVEQLTGAEKQQAFFNATVAAAAPLMAKVPLDATADKYARLAAQAENAKNSIAAATDAAISDIGKVGGGLLSGEAFSSAVSAYGSPFGRDSDADRRAEAAAQAQKARMLELEFATTEYGRAIRSVIRDFGEWTQANIDARRHFDEFNKSLATKGVGALSEGLGTLAGRLSAVAGEFRDSLTEAQRFAKYLQSDEARNMALALSGAFPMLSPVLTGATDPARAREAAEAAKAAARPKVSRGGAAPRPVTALDIASAPLRSPLADVVGPADAGGIEGVLARVGGDGPGVLSMLPQLFDATAAATGRLVGALQYLEAAANDLSFGAKLHKQLEGVARQMTDFAGMAVGAATSFGTAIGQGIAQMIIASDDGRESFKRLVGDALAGLSAQAFGYSVLLGGLAAAAALSGPILGWSAGGLGAAAAVMAGTGAALAVSAKALGAGDSVGGGGGGRGGGRASAGGGGPSFAPVGGSGPPAGVNVVNTVIVNIGGEKVAYQVARGARADARRRPRGQPQVMVR